MPPIIRQKHLALGLAISGALLVAVIVGAIVTRSALDSDIGSVRRTITVINSLHRLQRLTIDAESKQRGFILTGDQSYFDAYSLLVEQTHESTDTLLELTRDDPTQQKRILTVVRTTDSKLVDLGQVIDLTRSEGLEAARQFMLASEKMRDMGDILSLIDAVLEEEYTNLALRDQARHDTLVSLTLIVALGAAIALASSIIGYLLLKRAQRAEERRRELAIQKAEALRADREKSAFLANMSHEIRTPMNAILGFTELLGDLVESPLQKKYVNAISSSGNMLLLLINDILDLSKIESGRLELNPAPTRLAEIASSLETLLRHRADNAGIDFKVRLTTPDCTVVLDRLRLRQILINLASNAIKFTEKGHVHIRLAATVRDTVADVTAVIEDTGIGISDDDLAKVFRPFTQGSTTAKEQLEGTGLGLTISRRLALLMGGDITAQSTLGAGTTFTLSIPSVPLTDASAVSEADTGAAPVDFSSLPPLKILVADDNEANRNLLTGIFQNSGHRIVEARDGQEAVELATAEKPDLILMDIRMPRLDGRAARKKIKETPGVADVPIIAVTASSMLKEEKKLRTKFDGFVRKPISRDSLYREMISVVPAANRSGTATDRSAQDAAPAVETIVLPQIAADFVRDRAPSLTSTMAIGEIAAFALELKTLAEDEAATPLAALAESLSQSCDSFELIAIESTLKRLIAAAQAPQQQPDPSADEE